MTLASSDEDPRAVTYCAGVVGTIGGEEGTAGGVGVGFTGGATGVSDAGVPDGVSGATLFDVGSGTTPSLGGGAGGRRT